MDIEVQGSRGGCGCMGCLSTFFSLGLSAGIGAVVLVGISASHTGSDLAALEAMQQCSPVTEALGTPLEQVWYSPGCGEYESSGSHATSQFSMSVRGPKGSASAWYSAERSGGPWVVRQATVDLPSGTVSVVPCAGGTPPDKPTPRPKNPRKRKSR